MANSVDPDQTAPIGAVCSVFTLFASMLNSSVMLGNYLQQTTSADNIFFLALSGLKINSYEKKKRKFHYSVYNSMDPDQAPCFVGADLGSNC